MTIKTLEEKILKGSLSMVAPDAEIDGKGTFIYTFVKEYVWGNFSCFQGIFMKLDSFDGQKIVGNVHVV